MRRAFSGTLAILLCLAALHPAQADDYRYRIRKFIGEVMPQEPQAPFDFTFSSLTNQPISTEVESNDISLSGLVGTVEAYISAPAGANAQMSVDGGLAWASSATVNETQTLRLRMTTSAQAATTLAATVRVGAFTSTWQTTTQAATGTPPTFLSTPVLSAQEGSAYVYNIMTDSDVPAATLAITLAEPAMPHAWLVFEDYGDWTARLSGTPPVGSASVFGVAPEFGSLPVVSAQNGEIYKYALVISDADLQDMLTVTAPTAPSWLSVIKGFQGNSYAWQLWGATPRIVNTAPEVSSSALTTASMGRLYIYTLAGSDDEKDEMTFSVAGPSWIKVVVGFKVNNHIWQLIGIPPTVNVAPAFSSTPVTTARDGILYQHDLAGTDSQEDLLMFSLEEGPSWLKLVDGFQGSSRKNQLMGVPPITVVPNAAPTFSVASPATTGTAGSAYSATFTVADTNPADVTAVSLQTTLPDGLAFENHGNYLRTALISGTPTAAGTTGITLRVTDQNGTYTDFSYTLTIN